MNKLTKKSKVDFFLQNLINSAKEQISELIDSDDCDIETNINAKNTTEVSENQEYNNPIVINNEFEKTETNIKIINNLENTRKKDIKCRNCNLVFNYRSSLSYHLKTLDDEKKHKCDKCDKKFIEISKLLRHKKIHTGEKPYSCENCKRGFR